MRTIYLDSDFKCYVTEAEGLTPVETDLFDGKCETYIEGYGGKMAPPYHTIKRYCQ